MWLKLLFGLSLLFLGCIIVISIVTIRSLMMTLRKLKASRSVLDRRLRIRLKPIYQRLCIMMAIANIIAIGSTLLTFIEMLHIK